MTETLQAEIVDADHAVVEVLKLRVVSANLAYWTPAGFKTLENRRRQWAYLGALMPDIAFLQECRPGDLFDLAPTWMEEEYTLIGTIPDRWTACSAVLVRKALHPEPASLAMLSTDQHRWIEALGGYLALATIRVGGRTIAVASVHASAREVDDSRIVSADHELVAWTGLTSAWYCDLMAAALRPFAETGSFVIGGDWNTARLFDEHYADLWGTSGTEFFQVLRSWGWCETLRKHHPTEVRTFLNPASGPYELDHIFTDGALHEECTSSTVLSAQPMAELSDHAFIVADFAMESSVGT